MSSIDWVPLADPSRRDAAITAIHVPAAVHVGDTVPLTLTVHSTVAATAVLRISRDGGHPASQSIRLRAGDNPLLLLYTATRRGWNSFSATIALSPATSNPATTPARRSSTSAPRPGCWSSPTASSRAAALLARRRLRVTTVAPGKLLFDTAAAYRRDDAVVLDDVPATALHAAQVDALVNAVRIGGLGAVALGGPPQLLAGRSLREVTAAADPPGRRQAWCRGTCGRHNLAIELVLDHSGSMIDEAGGVPKIQMACRARRPADGVVHRQAPRRASGIVDFDVAAHVLTLLRRLSPGASQKSVDAWIATLQADGGTSIYQGLKQGPGCSCRTAPPSSAT